MKGKAIIFLTLIIFSSLFSASFISSQQQADYTKYFLYVTSNDYTGNLSGRYGADAICNMDVPLYETERPTTGFYKAYISTDGNYPGTILGMDITRPIYNINNTLIANNMADLEDGKLINPIWAKTLGNFVPVWTGINDSGSNCNGWTDETAGGVEGLIGQNYANEKAGQWAIFGKNYCYVPHRIYCIGPFESGSSNYCGDGACDAIYEDCENCAQDCGMCNTGIYYMFVTQSQYDGNLNGTYGADQKCNSDTNKPAVGIYKAFLSTNTNYPLIENMYMHWKIYSADTFKKIANNYADLIDGEIDNPIYPSLMWTRVFTGGMTTSACNSWTSNLSTLRTNYGYPYAVEGYYPPVFSSLWWNTGEDACNDKKSLYCIGPFYEGTYCGDGLISEGEVCDDGLNNGMYGYCNEYCSGKSAYCGDGTCSDGETCSSCPTDCGSCPVNNGGSSGGGGGGGSSSSSSGGSSIPVTPVYNGKTYSFSVSETQTGKPIELRQKDIVEFFISFEGEEEKHTITLLSVQENYITIQIQSEIITDTIKIGEIKKYDITADNFYDLQVTLNSITNGKADLEIKTIDEKINLDSGLAKFIKQSWQRMVLILIAFVCLIAIIILKNLKKKKKIKI